MRNNPKRDAASGGGFPSFPVARPGLSGAVSQNRSKVPFLLGRSRRSVLSVISPTSRSSDRVAGRMPRLNAGAGRVARR